MICDLCKPINEGEGNTVRIVMSLDEARSLLQGDESELKILIGSRFRTDSANKTN